MSDFNVGDKVYEVDESYNKGLNDAWELAKKIVINPDDDGYTAEELGKFGTIVPSEVFAFFTPQEALAKVKEYEECNNIKVGDVVKYKCNGCSESIVTKVVSREIYRLFKDGSCGSYTKKDLVKTGKHFDSIDEFMRS